MGSLTDLCSSYVVTFLAFVVIVSFSSVRSA